MMLTPEDFLKLPQAVEAGLTIADVIGLRLYTGPTETPLIEMQMVDLNEAQVAW